METQQEAAPPAGECPQSVRVIEMHSGGEPLRIIESVRPQLQLQGDSLMEKRRELRDRHDQLRQFVINEPRGHADMYAVLLLPACDPAAHMSALFMHNEGYSTMCGHAVMALTKYSVINQIVTATPPVTDVNIECPCGVVKAKYHHSYDGAADSTSFVSIPSFLYDSYSSSEQLPAFDIAYGGAYYIILPGSSINIDIHRHPIADITAACQQLKRRVEAEVQLRHKENKDLAFIYGVIATDGRDEEEVSDHLCVFADGQVDRCPTGSGVTARMAALSARGLVAMGTDKTFRNSKTGTLMTARLAELLNCGSVRVEVMGSASFIGTAELTAEPGDQLLPGFRIK